MVSDVYTVDRENQRRGRVKKRLGPEFLLCPEFKASRSFEIARLDLWAAAAQSQKMRVEITGG